MRRYGTTEDGVSVLEYVLLVALVAMVATGTLLYLGRSSGSPSHVANNVGDNVAVGGNGDPGNVGNNVAVGSNSVSGIGGNTSPLVPAPVPKSRAAQLKEHRRARR